MLNNVSSMNSPCDKSYMKETDDIAMMLIQVNFTANKVINLIRHMSAFVAFSCYFKFIELTLNRHKKLIKV